MNTDPSEDKCLLLYQHPDYRKARWDYVEEEDERVRAEFTRRYGEMPVEEMESAVFQILDSSEEVETPEGGLAWLYSYKGVKLLAGYIQLKTDKSGVVYGFQEL